VGASRAALGHPDAALRVASATALGDEAAGALVAVARDRTVAEEVRVRAVQQLASRCSRAATVQRLDDLLASEAVSLPMAVLTAVAVALGELKHADSVPRLAALAPPADARLGLALARVLGDLGDASVELALLTLLAMDDDAVRTAAARALGRVGTVAAVELLLPHSKGLLTDGDVKRAARDAIAAIQSRLGDVEAGRLALADGTADAGGLSLAQQPGQLSVTPDEAGLSLTSDPGSPRDPGTGARRGP
jgi:hypothetical protein